MRKLKIAGDYVHTPPKKGAPRHDLRKPKHIQNDPDLKEEIVEDDDLKKGTAENLKVKFRNAPIDIIVEDLDLEGSVHQTERMNRTDNQGADITIKEVKDTINYGIPAIFSDIANGELGQKAYVNIFNKDTNLNVICALIMKKGQDQIKVMTVMRKKNFKEKPGTKRYVV